jgi:hypothetical protein
MLGAATVALLLGSGCGEEKKRTDEGCKPEDASSCAEGLVCEQLGDGGERFECLPPVIVSGRVFDALDEETGIADATVVGLDVNGAARTRVARTMPDGSYELPVSMRRDEDGSPVEEAITLRVAAANHQPFPVAPRTALPIQLADAVKQAASDAGAEAEESWRFMSAATDVALLPLPDDQLGGATVAGRVVAESAGGVLVVAAASDRAASTAISDLDGEFILFNVPKGEALIEGYKAGLALEPEQVDVPAAGLTEVVLEGAEAQLGTVSGSINIVNAEGGAVSSVILVVASTFDATAVRGETPAGLRAADVSGAFEIANVPPGRYAVLAAFEDDGLVRDPDENIAGTDVVFVDVPAGGGDVALEQSFKVTGALSVHRPGADGIEVVPAGIIQLEWADDSSEDGYELRVYDAFGELVLEESMLPSVSGGGKVSYALDGADLTPGMLYQFRVRSFRDKGGLSFISASEDLKGVFEIQR